MKPDRFIKLDGLDLFVFDRSLNDDTIENIDTGVRGLAFNSRSSSNRESQVYREWAATLAVEDFQGHPVYRTARDRLRSLYPALDFEFWDVHCNSTIFGDWAFAHKDSNEAGAYSALYYANRQWKQEWFGETVFYTEGEPVVAISARPGRLVLFDSRIEHRAGVPAMNCAEPRFTLSLRFSTDRVGRYDHDLKPEVY